MGAVEQLEDPGGLGHLPGRQGGGGGWGLRRDKGRASWGRRGRGVGGQWNLGPGWREQIEPALVAAFDADVILETGDVGIQSAALIGLDLWTGGDFGIADLVEGDQVARMSLEEVGWTAAAGFQTDQPDAGVGLGEVDELTAEAGDGEGSGERFFGLAGAGGGGGGGVEDKPRRARGSRTGLEADPEEEGGEQGEQDEAAGGFHWVWGRREADGGQVKGKRAMK